MKRYIFEVEYGGLGDHLFYSPLPRLLKEIGMADEVYLAKRSPFRNLETYDLVWQTNPFLDGIADEAPSKFVSCPAQVQRVINLEMAKHGIALDKEINPEIHSKIETEPRYKGTCYLDINYISFAGAISVVDQAQLVRRLADYVLVNPPRHILPFASRPPVYTSSIFDYASIIQSADRFSAFTSGGATLAAALGKPCDVFFGYGHNPINRHSCNQHIQLGGDNFYRRWLSNKLLQKNLKRLRVQESK